jgi:RNA polymerase sigma-70 factor, ECF subfamily
MLGSIEDAEDLVQETMLRAWKGRAGFEGRSMLQPGCTDRDERLPRRP